ncbi:high-affinity Zn(2+) transporter zrt1 [Madurella fahalii]|uniref:High-affinity Zn(2+) transporter zrt1 n=1 Tax=Madurella fahalii TaxID=1157608 RepID=A0ABQ0GIE5_9PEZI
MLVRARSVLLGATIALFIMALMVKITGGFLPNTGWRLPSILAKLHRDEAELTAVSRCRLVGSDIICASGEVKYLVHATVTSASELSPQFSGCHAHESRIFCLTGEGADVEIEPLENATTPDSKGVPGERHCHFHAGVEHCIGDKADASALNCERIDRDYNIPLRVVTLVVVLIASSVGVYGPILVAATMPLKTSVISAILKQFGTGIIISTAFVHLLTHAILMFQNECLGELSYEATPAVILMAGIFVSFLAECCVQQILMWRSAKKRKTLENIVGAEISADLVNVVILEAGIIFHSLLIGLTLVVTGDSFFGTLAAVIVFHQAFEGIALGTRIAALGHPGRSAPTVRHSHHHHSFGPEIQVVSAGETAVAKVSTMRKLFLASGFAFVTPAGMAIGISILNVFNGNDPSTIMAIGTIDAFSAGILVWIGVVEMWAHDWMIGGEIAQLGSRDKFLCLAGLLAGMVSMSVLGKWA